MAEIHELGALELAAAVRAGDLAVREVVQHALARAERLGPHVGAFATVTRGLAEHQALALDTRLAEARRTGTPAVLPPLTGVPCPIKDLAMVAGVPMRAGSGAIEPFVPRADDGVVTLLREAGTVMLGKTNTPELGLPPYTEPAVAPPARTPWDLTRSAGGSSGGAAAAVASRIVPVAHGNDGGGSLRIPASTCGLVGHKTSRGLISSGPHGVDGPGLVSEGVLTRTVRETAAVLDVLARPRLGDLGRPVLPEHGLLQACDTAPDGQDRTSPVRVGVLTSPVVSADAPVHPACLAAVDHAVQVLDALGADIGEAATPFPAADWEPFMALWSVGALQAPLPPEAENRLRPLTRWLRARGRETSGLEHAQALQGMQRMTRQCAQSWDAFDVILTPTLAQPPAMIGALRDDDDPAGEFAAQTRYTPWTSLANITGRPAISLPLHRTRVEPEGPILPIGVMLTGRWGQDAALLRLARQIERVEPWAPALAQLPEVA